MSGDEYFAIFAVFAGFLAGYSWGMYRIIRRRRNR